MNKDYERRNRIAECLSIRNLKQVDLVERARVHKGSLSHWIKQDYQPKQNALLSMAKVLDVSPLWLAGYEVPMEESTETEYTETHTYDLDNTKELGMLMRKLCVDDDLLELCINISDLTPEQLSAISNMVNLLKNKSTKP